MANVLMISFDDLNDYVSVLGGYKGNIHTPNFDRLSESGVTFANAFTPLSSCNGSRTATLTGLSPLTTGVVENDQSQFGYHSLEVTLPSVLKNAGMETVHAGKVFHSLPADVSQKLFDRDLVNYDYLEGVSEEEVVPILDIWEDGSVYTGNTDELRDEILATRVADFLQQYVPLPGSAGVFLAAGIGSPHRPRAVPQEFFDLYPLDQIVLPDRLAGDLADVPAIAAAAAEDPNFQRYLTEGDWPKVVQAYLASISYADHILGRILDALDASTIADDTMVLLWSDNGYHLGEKGVLGKGTLWDESTRINLIIADPHAPESSRGHREEQVVSLLDVFPTIVDFVGLPTAP